MMLAVSDTNVESCSQEATPACYMLSYVLVLICAYTGPRADQRLPDPGQDVSKSLE